MSLWFKRACGLAQDPAMQNVMLDHSAIAIPVFEELMALCKISRGAGRVAVAYDLLARRLMMKTPKVKAIVVALDRETLIAIVHDETDARALVADIPGWKQWNPKDPSGSDRQRRYRERQTGKGHEISPVAASVRRTVLDRDGRCLACGTTDDLVVDHVIPKSQGGTNHVSNLQTLCGPCNYSKGTGSDDFRGFGDGDA